MWWRRWVRRQGLVNLTDGTAVTGVIYRASTRHGVEIRNAQIISPGQSAPIPAEGTILVLADRIAFIQINGA